MHIIAYMRVFKLFLSLFSIIIIIPSGYGQDVAIGQWKDYLSYYQCTKVSQGQNTMYCTSQAGVFAYNLKDNSITRYNKITGLSDIGTTVARYTSYGNTLFIGYSDGNMDVLQNGQITNMPELKTSYIQGNKTINDVYFINNDAYVSCGQGIMQIDLSQDIILNTFYIGPDGTALNVRGLTVYNDSIFAATDNGIYKAYLHDANLNNFNDWKKVTSPVLCPGKYNNITTVGNTLYTSYSKSLSKGVSMQDTIYTYSGGEWAHYTYVQGTDNVLSLESSNGYLVISGQNDVKVINASGTLVKDVSGYGSAPAIPNDAIVDANMNLWIADNSSGMVESAGQGTGQIFCPPGPYSNNIFSMAVSNNNIWITPGGYDAGFGPLYIHTIGVSAYYNNTWYRLLDSYDSLTDINCIAVDPSNPAHAFAGTWHNGVVEYNIPYITNVYNTGNSSVQNNYTGAYSIRNGGLAFDTLGNLWISNDIPATKYISVRKKDGTWDAFDFSFILPSNCPATQLMVTQSGAKWLVVPSRGILVYQDNGTFAQPNANNATLITNIKGHGGLPDLNVETIAQDKDGAIWVGTDQQVVVFYSPDNVLDGQGDWDCDSVFVTQTGYTQLLMQNQVTTAIAIDGANRKWIGTQSGGVFLMSTDGTQQIENFTSSNSPLLSNDITCIKINPNNGEVFFGTDKGLVSYRGTATEGTNNFGNVYAFPNPIPHGYNGNVAINGLVANSDVKITDINGDLVYHTTSLGGQAIWNCTTFSGQRVKTGVYLVFCASPDGSQTRVTKLLFIN